MAKLRFGPNYFCILPNRTVELTLTQGQVTIIDLEDFDLVISHRWYAYYDPSTKSYYAATSIRQPNGKQTTLRLHRFLLNITDRSLIADHRDHNILNNRRSNLRIATASQSNMNRKIFSNNSSGFTCVTWYSRDKCWCLRINGKHYGCFGTIDEAVTARDLIRPKLQGEFECLD